MPSNTSASYSIDTFLENCRISSQSAYDCFKKLLADLENPLIRKTARAFLEQLKDRCEEEPESEEFTKSHFFFIEKLAIAHDAREDDLLYVLQFPSIFTPEEWSFTFFEGLARLPQSEFQGRSICELGCGNGWISIAICKRFLPTKVYGLDINPRAIVCAKINLFMNGLDKFGNVIETADGNPLIDSVKFLTSDLLTSLKEANVSLDRIIGCIPQVLNPDPQTTLSYVAEHSSDDFLYSLSNYCEKQGYVEDQFGLGLIARALEESVDYLRPSGKVILNLGGRPGQGVLQRLFTRRGFEVSQIWHTKVLQAGDTDIRPLVEIEENSQHRFEFYLGLQGEEPVSARTASAYVNAGGAIAHSLSVYEGKVRHPAHVKKILQILRFGGFEEARSALDLTFDDNTLADEKIAFLAELSDKVTQDNVFPYEKTDGLPEFRRRIAEFFRSYWKIPVTAKNFLVAPNRGELIKNILLLFRPHTALVDRDLARSLPHCWKGGHRNTQVSTHKGENLDSKNLKTKFVSPPLNVLEIPKAGSQIVKLVEKIRPKLVACGLAEFEWRSADTFLRLVEATRAVGSMLVLDISPEFNLSSQPGSNAVLNHLAENSLPEHVVLLCGLVKNRVFADLEVAFVFSENEHALDALKKAAEVTYSRTPLVSQMYYDRILFDLLNFQIPRHKRGSTVRHFTNSPKFQLELAPPAVNAFSHNCFAVDSWNISKSTARLDYGENELPAPTLLTSALLEAFARQSTFFSDQELHWALRNHAKQRFGIERGADLRVLIANGVAPLFAGIVEIAQQKHLPVFFPEGGYGYFEASTHFFGADLVKIQTYKSDNYKLNATTLFQSLAKELGEPKSADRNKGNVRAWLYLNAPLVNPTGARYFKAELRAIFEVCEQYSCGLVLDTIFAGLDFYENNAAAAYFSDLENYANLPFVLLGGFSKELAGGGLRFGYALTHSHELFLNLQEGIQSAPHSTVKYAALKVLHEIDRADGALTKHLNKQALLLKERAERLEEILVLQGWDVLPPKGGLFLVASPTKIIGKKLIYKEHVPEHLDTHITNENLVEHLFLHSNCLINGDKWTGIPGHFRFVLSTSEETFAAGLEALKNFYDCLE